METSGVQINDSLNTKLVDYVARFAKRTASKSVDGFSEFTSDGSTGSLKGMFALLQRYCCNLLHLLRNGTTVAKVDALRNRQQRAQKKYDMQEVELHRRYIQCCKTLLMPSDAGEGT